MNAVIKNVDKGMRNRLIHGCDSIHSDVLWSTIQEDLPALIDALKAYRA